MFAIFFPKTCSICKSISKTPLCENCINEIEFLDLKDCCVSCGAPFNHIVKDEKSEALCIRCIRKEFHFERARSIVIHQGLVKNLIHKFKYREKIVLKGALTQLITERFPSGFSSFDTAIPVPLYIKKLRKREFNQSSVIAKYIAKKFGCSFDPFSLVKRLENKSQFEIGNLNERIKNVAGVFHISNTNSIESRSVLLVDDVFTTGSTINECSKVLLQAGAEKVQVLTLTRAAF
ncbi:MAG: ComF family protein [Thermodesulfobacteriota bacterium]